MTKLHSLFLAAVLSVACNSDIAQPPAALAAVSDPPVISRFVSNGEGGVVLWFVPGPTGSTFGSLYFSRGGPVTNPQTFLSYNIVHCADYHCEELENGNGIIPNSDVSGNAKKLHLSTNTSNNPNFTLYAGHRGNITIDLEVNGLYSQRSEGVMQTTTGDTLAGSKQTFRQQGIFTAFSAWVSGSVVGTELPVDATGYTDTAHNVQILISR